jgi:hypothetical protein
MIELLLLVSQQLICFWMLNKEPRTTDDGWSSSIGERLTTPPCKKPHCYEMLYRASEFDGGTSGRRCEHGNEPSSYIKGREFLH